jgi:hypothetical protein
MTFSSLFGKHVSNSTVSTYLMRAAAASRDADAISDGLESHELALAFVPQAEGQ